MIISIILLSCNLQHYCIPSSSGVLFHDTTVSYHVLSMLYNPLYWVVDLTRLILREVVSQPSCLWEVLLDTSSQISHMFWACCVSDANRSGTMLWTGTGIHLGNPYACRVVCVDCPLSSDKKIAKCKNNLNPFNGARRNALYRWGKGLQT